MKGFLRLPPKLIIRCSFSCYAEPGRYSSPESCRLIDGKKIAKNIRIKVKAEVKKWMESGNRSPTLCALLVGDDPASHAYVNIKLKAAKRVGISASVINLSSHIQQQQLISKINLLNADPQIDGILVQLPLPEHICERSVCNAVAPAKDVDGFTVANMGRLALNLDAMVPCTALAVLHIIRSTGVDLQGKTAVVCGRSKNVGLPISLLLHSHKSGEVSGLGMTTSICHRHTPHMELQRLTRDADVIVSATGVPRLITGDMVKAGAIVIDVGIKRILSDAGEPSFIGDVDFEDVSKIAGMLTPVPGGVGPVTVAMLMSNTLRAAQTPVLNSFANGDLS